MRIAYPPIRVHIWGGLGSQLYAWALLISLKERFPHRELEAVFHNGGVTQRESELNSYMAGIRKDFVRDYVNISHNSLLTRFCSQLGALISGALRFPFKFLGLVAQANTNNEFGSLKPWVISLRGHYSKRTILPDVSSLISKEFFHHVSISDNNYRNSELAIHFRLGDLLHLETKKPLEVQSLVTGLRHARNSLSNADSEIIVCSDSIDIATSMLGACFPDAKFAPAQLPPRETVFLLTQASKFVGTPSKISEWVAVFRVHGGENQITWLPRQMESHMSRILGETQLIHYF